MKPKSGQGYGKVHGVYNQWNSNINELFFYVREKCCIVLLAYFVLVRIWYAGSGDRASHRRG